MTELTNNNFSIRCYLIILSISHDNLKQYILLNKNMDIPNFLLESNNISGLEKYIHNQATNIVFSDPIELIPQLISFNSSNIKNNNETELNLIYGFIMDHTDKIHDSVLWDEFHYASPHKYSDIIFEVSQKLR